MIAHTFSQAPLRALRRWVLAFAAGLIVAVLVTLWASFVWPESDRPEKQLTYMLLGIWKNEPGPAEKGIPLDSELDFESFKRREAKLIKSHSPEIRVDFPDDRDLERQTGAAAIMRVTWEAAGDNRVELDKIIRLSYMSQVSKRERAQKKRKLDPFRVGMGMGPPKIGTFKDRGDPRRFGFCLLVGLASFVVTTIGMAIFFFNRPTASSVIASYDLKSRRNSW
jgi:hypothetical protein